MLAQPGALTAAIDWYRSMSGTASAATPPASMPTLYVWSDQDPSLGRDAAEATAALVTGDVPVRGARRRRPLDPRAGRRPRSPRCCSSTSPPTEQAGQRTFTTVPSAGIRSSAGLSIRRVTASVAVTPVAISLGERARPRPAPRTTCRSSTPSRCSRRDRRRRRTGRRRSSRRRTSSRDPRPARRLAPTGRSC